MMQFDIVTIFPSIFDSYLDESLIKKAREKKLIKISVHDLRKWAKGRHKPVDDKPFGGGMGMVLKIEPVYKALKSLRKKGKKCRVIFFSPRGKAFSQKKAYLYSKYDQVIMVCGRYEGIDERAEKHLADEVVSIGEYDLMGGEIPAMAVLEAVSRLIPGVIGKKELLKERVTKRKGFLEYPQYTRPEVFEPEKGKKWKVPEVLLSGNHKEIRKWREAEQKEIL